MKLLTSLRHSFLIAVMVFGLQKIADAQVTVTGSTGADATYTSLTNTGGAFDLINASPQTGNNILITITSDVLTEAGTISLNAGAWTALTINPSGGVARSISGAVAGPLINLNGADNVTIDGLNTGGNSLTISNTTAGATSSTIRFIADATNNIVRNSSIEGSSTSATIGTIFFSTGTSTGNDNNIITANTITSAGANLPVNAIYSAGTSGAIDNSGISITNNNIQDYFSSIANSNGIFVASNSSSWTITGNKFFQTADRTLGAFSYRAINIITSSGVNYNISNNTIGYANTSGTGITTYTGTVAGLFRAIEMTVGTSTPSNIQGNTITGISFTTTSNISSAPGVFTGISILAGAVNVGTITGNTIGASSGISSITIKSNTNGYIAGIYATSTNTVNIHNNNIGSIATAGDETIGNTFHGINTAGTLGNFIITNNTIGSLTTANSIAMGSVGSTTGVNGFNGITNAATGTIAITNNTIQNCASYGSPLAGSVFRGISNTATVTGTLTISTNNINTGFCSGSSLLAGISNTGNAATAYILKNKIYNLHKEGAAGILSGILITNGTAVNVYNNLVGDLKGPISSGDNAICGINITSTAANTSYNVFYNSIYLNAFSSELSFGTSGVYHSATGLSSSASLYLRNNLIVNLSTSGSSRGETVAFRRGVGSVNGSLGANYVLVSNNNSFYAGIPSPQRLIFSDGVNNDQTLENYKVRVAPSDSSSITVNPDFISTSGADLGFLHLVTTSNCALDGSGFAISGDDFDGDVRSATPDIGADEFASSGSAIPSSPSIAGTTTICSGNSTILYASGLPEATFSWFDAASGGNLLASTATFTTPILTNTTTYYVQQTNCAGTNATRTSVTVIVNDVPSAAGSITGTSSPICQTQSGVVYSVGSIAGATGYSWTYSGTGFNIVSGSTTSSITANYLSATSGNLTVKGTNICGIGTISPTFSVSFTTPPTTANAGTDQSTCGPTATLAGNTPTSGTGIWTVVSGNATITAPSSPTSGLTGLSTNGASVTLRWTISNGTCAPSSDEVRIACPPHQLNSCSSCHVTHNNPLGDRELVKGNANVCISCHNSTGIAHQKAINNGMMATPGVKGNSHSWDKPAVNATYEANAPTEANMASNLPSGKIICSTCHDQHDNSKKGSPYLRGYATANELCKDCHSARNVGSYSSNPSTNKGSHPVGGVYPTSDPRFKEIPTGSITLVSGKVECTSCHTPHYAASNDGNLLRQTNDDNLCKECHTYSSHNGQGCSTCHGSHNNNKNNILLTRNTISTPNSGTKSVTFTSRTGANSFADGDGNFNGICEVCHTTTAYHRNDGSALTTHKSGTNCMSCHSHSNNFAAPTCGSTSCHPASGGSFGAEGAHATHTQRYGYSCSTCHFQRGSKTDYHLDGNVDVNFDPNGLATRNGLDANIPAYNSVNKTCSNVYCHSNGRSAFRGTDGTYTWSNTIGSQTAVYNTTPNWLSGTFSSTSCNSVDGCHDGMLNYTRPVGPSYNVTVPGPLPNLGSSVAGTYQPNSGAHRTANHTDNDRNWSPGSIGSTTWSTVLCFSCHNTDGADQDSPNKMGTYGTSFHVDGQTYFKPLLYPAGTSAPWNERAYDGANAHCGNSSKCW